MNRTVVIAAAVLLLQGTGAHAQNVSAKQWQQYKTWAQAFYPENDVALAVAPNGSHCSHFGRSKTQAKNNALDCCKTSQDNSTKATCKIFDVNLGHFKPYWRALGWCAKASGAFLTTRSDCDDQGAKWYPSYETAKEVAKTEALKFKKPKGWCANSFNVSTASSWLTRDVCLAIQGKWFLTEAEAQAAHRRLKNQSSTVATTSANSSATGWCVNSVNLFRSSERSCSKNNGTWYSTLTLAAFEHKRLKAASSLTSGSVSTASTTTQTTQTEETQSLEVGKIAEIEFWKTIKDSDDPDMFREYLRQFPSGTYAGLAKIKIKKLGGSATSVAKTSTPDLDYGNYHALVIGNNRYRHLKPLSTAVNDANAVASLLRSQYQFKVDVLINATRAETVSALSRLRKSITPRDNLLIYYAGHGWLDKEMDEGFWLPVDATDDDQVDWIANDTIMRSVRAMKAKHVMVVADSCFSGTLIRGIKIKERSPDYIKEISQKKARTALTSGGIEPVTDVGGGDHSIFAATFIRILSENDGVLDGHQLFTTLRKRVMMGADQTPEYGDIRKAGHDGGDFLFVRQ